VTIAGTMGRDPGWAHLVDFEFVPVRRSKEAAGHFPIEILALQLFRPRMLEGEKAGKSSGLQRKREKALGFRGAGPRLAG